MKIKILLGLIAALAFSTAIFAQSAKVTPRKMTYKRPKPMMDFKKTFTITHPKVSGLTPTMNKKVEAAVSYEKNFDFTIKEEMGEIQWLEEASYEVAYNKNGILNILLSITGTGAYPSTSNKSVIVNLKTGEQVKFADVFKADSLAEFAESVNKKLAVEKAEVIRMVEKGEFGDGESSKEANEALKEQLSGLEFTADAFDEFTVGDQGATIIYDAGFPHAIRAAQPDGRYFFTWAELKPFIKPDGLLARFVR